MDAGVWFEEDLSWSASLEGNPTKSPGTPETPADYFATAYRREKPKVVVDLPRFREISEGLDQLRSANNSTFAVIRLGFQLLPGGDETRAPLAFARCSARLERVDNTHLQPRIHDLYPRELFAGKPTTVQLTLSTKFEAGPLTMEGGLAATDLTIGKVEPAIAGWAGEDERHPFWNIHPQNQNAFNMRHFWLLVEMPHPARSLQIAVLAEADLASRFGPLKVGPKQRLWDQRPAHRIDLD